MYEGGREKVTVMATDVNRKTIKLGNKRLLDVVTTGGKKLVEYKEKHGDAVTVDASDLVGALNGLMK